MYDKSCICAIIVSYNTEKKLLKCFDSIYKQVQEVVIVDNGSNRETIDVLNELEKLINVKIIYNKENNGIAAALNQGVKYAINNGYEWILTLDHDSIASHDMLKNMLNAYDNLSDNEKEETAMITANNIEISLLNDDELDKYKRSSTIREIISEITSGNLVKTKIFKEVGFYNENLFIDYVDHEFCLRLKKYNYKIFLIENALLFHRLGNINKKDLLIKDITYTNHSYLRRYYITRNRIYVWKKYFRIAPIWVINDIIASIKEFIKIILFEQDKVLKIKMVLKGIHDNILNIYGELNLKKISKEVSK